MDLCITFCYFLKSFFSPLFLWSFLVQRRGLSHLWSFIPSGVANAFPKEELQVLQKDLPFGSALGMGGGRAVGHRLGFPIALFKNKIHRVTKGTNRA